MKVIRDVRNGKLRPYEDRYNKNAGQVVPRKGEKVALIIPPRMVTVEGARCVCAKCNRSLAFGDFTYKKLEGKMQKVEGHLAKCFKCVTSWDKYDRGVEVVEVREAIECFVSSRKSEAPDLPPTDGIEISTHAESPPGGGLRPSNN